MESRVICILTLFLVLAGCDSGDLHKEEITMLNFDKGWDYDDPVSTEIKFKGILATFSYEDHPQQYLELQTQIARTLGLQQKFDEAHALLDQVESHLSADQPIPRIRYLLERGRCYNSANRQAQARPLFLEAWETSQAAGADFYAVDAGHMMAIVEPPEKQLEWNEKAVAIAEKSEDPRARGWLGPLYNNIGWTYHDLGNYEQALAVFEKALDWRMQHQQVNETLIAKWSVARTHRSLGHVDQALGLQMELLQTIKAAGLPEDGYVEEEIAECLTLQGKTREASRHFFKAWALLSKDIWLQQNETPRLERLKQLGQEHE